MQQMLENKVRHCEELEQELQHLQEAVSRRSIELTIEAKESEEADRKVTAQLSEELQEKHREIAELQAAAADNTVRWADLESRLKEAEGFLSPVTPRKRSRLTDAAAAARSLAVAALAVSSPPSSPAASKLAGDVAKTPVYTNGKVSCTITLDTDFAKVGTPGTKARQQFEFFLTSDLAEASGLPRKEFDIKKLAPGSVVVDLEILAQKSGKTALQVAENLKFQTYNPKSVLKGGQVTRSIQTFEIQPIAPSTSVAAPTASDASRIVGKLKVALIAAHAARAEAETEAEKAVLACGEVLSKVTVQQGEITMKESELNAKQIELTETHRELTILSEELSAVKMARDILQRNCDELKGEVEKLTTQLEIRVTKEEVNLLMDQLERQKEEAAILRSAVLRMQGGESEQVVKMEEETMTLKSQLVEARYELKTSEKEVIRLKNELIHLQTLESEEGIRAVEEASQLRVTVLDLKEDIKTLELRRAEEVAILEAEKSRLGEVLAAGARRCAALETAVAELESKVTVQQREMTVKETELNEKQIELTEKHMELTILLEDLSAVNMARDIFQRNCDELQLSCSSLKVTSEHSKATCAALQLEVQKTVADMKARVHTMCLEFQTRVQLLEENEDEMRQELVALALTFKSHPGSQPEGVAMADMVSESPSPRSVRLESRLDVMRYQLHEEEERRQREVLRDFSLGSLLWFLRVCFIKS